MADPLAAYAEREVPAPTNYFNPADAQTVISRYASARRGAESSGALAESAGRMFRLQEDQDRLARDKVMQGREDLDYEARKDALRQRGDFIRTMGQSLDPKSPDYNAQVTEFMAGLPEDLADDDTIRGVLTSMNAEADDFRSQRNAEVSKTQTRDNQLAVIRERAKLGMSYDVKDEDVKAATREDGSIDEFKLGTIAGANKRSNAANEFDRRLKAREEGRLRLIQAADLSKRGRERRSTVDKYIVEDRAAFPRHIDTVVSEYKTSTGKKAVDPKMLETNPKWRDAVAQAKSWDSKPLESELSAAFAYDEPEKYVNLVKGLTDSQKERRRMVWEHAHKDGAVEEDEGTTSAPSGDSVPAAKEADRAPPAAESKPLDRDTGMQFLKDAGGDKAKARELARAAGFTF